jgi:hypothetical protein
MGGTEREDSQRERDRQNRTGRQERWKGKGEIELAEQDCQDRTVRKRLQDRAARTEVPEKGASTGLL